MSGDGAERHAGPILENFCARAVACDRLAPHLSWLGSARVEIGAATALFAKEPLPRIRAPDSAPNPWPSLRSRPRSSFDCVR